MKDWRTQFWKDLNRTNEAELSKHDRVLFTKAREQLNHAMDLIESAIEKIHAMDISDSDYFITLKIEE